MLESSRRSFVGKLQRGQWPQGFALEEELVATGPAGHPGHSVSPPHPETVDLLKMETSYSPHLCLPSIPYKWLCRANCSAQEIIPFGLIMVGRGIQKHTQ